MGKKSKSESDFIDTSNTISTYNKYDNADISLDDSRIRSITPKFSSVIDNALGGEALKEALSVNIGSTYSLINQPRENSTSEPSLCMDAAHYGRMPLGDGRYAIFTAIADGTGGHYGDERQDREIAKMADLAAKTAVSYMADATALSGGDYEKLESHMKNIRYAVAKELYSNADTGLRGEGTTLAFSTVIVEKDGSQKVIGGNIGDSLIASYNPQTKEWQTLSPAKQDPLGTDMITSSHFSNPETLKKQEINLFKADLPKGAFLIPMTDGVYDGLPTQSKEVGNKQEGPYHGLISLDTEKMPKMEKNNPTAKDMQDLIKKTVQENTNKEKKDLTKRAVGDDYTSLIVDSSKVSKICTSINILKGINVKKEKDGTMKFTARSEEKMNDFQKKLDALGIQKAPKSMLGQNAYVSKDSANTKELFDLAEKKLNPSLMKQVKRAGKNIRDNLKDIGNSMKEAGSKVGSKLSNLSKNLPKGKISGIGK